MLKKLFHFCDRDDVEFNLTVVLHKVAEGVAFLNILEQLLLIDERFGLYWFAPVSCCKIFEQSSPVEILAI